MLGTRRRGGSNLLLLMLLSYLNCKITPHTKSSFFCLIVAYLSINNSWSSSAVWADDSMSLSRARKRRLSALRERVSSVTSNDPLMLPPSLKWRYNAREQWPRATSTPRPPADPRDTSPWRCFLGVCSCLFVIVITQQNKFMVMVSFVKIIL